MSESIIYQDPKTMVTLSEESARFVSPDQNGHTYALTVSRAAMNEIVRGYERELEQEQEREAKP